MVIVKNWKLIYRWGILKELLEIKIKSIIIYIIKQNNVNFFIILFKILFCAPGRAIRSTTQRRRCS